MDMFNKLRSAVSSALPGNPLSKDFDVSNHIASGGPELSWKIYNAVKKTTKQVKFDMSVTIEMSFTADYQQDHYTMTKTSKKAYALFSRYTQYVLQGDCV
jgi:hypothetical protein